ncbi:MAG: tRNA pseudouridine(55) synthase TruB [Fimbriimonas ginsengisoli]|uniref:tRNA pseudouridine synthase B n=1 Tax=Fimbriimonas ginsengisoli TaxID=1005039 RepID=A0A931LUY2_FIMGI|nr:tRNA pseudouridine(55) synthase TruB [Fimbriimonas ginsengisoli]MBI3721749.1 tRNA pseudouridine(55) synthase TruB [Fimbriimonas ginsengisoli]
MLGILLIAKPGGVSSHDVVDEVRRRLSTRRVGHAGTLDPQATGLLVVAVGPATRFLQYLPLEPKEYVGTIRFGVETETFDGEGAVVAQHPAPDDLPGAVERALPAFRGLIKQVPPMFSAVKVEGKPLYKYAREGKELERAERTVHIGLLEIVSVDPPDVEVRVECSGGTYVRTLAHDLGRAVGCGAHLARLSRVRVGRFTLGDACSVEALSKEHVIRLASALEPMPLAQLTESQVTDVREGRAVASPEAFEDDHVALLGPDGEAFGVARVQGNLLQPECVIPAEAMNGAR